MKFTNENERAKEGGAGDTIIVALCLSALVYICGHVSLWGVVRGFAFVTR